MQDFLHTNHDDVLEAVERFEKMINTDKVVYFDVHQVESIFDFYLEKSLFKQAEKILGIGLRQHPQATALLVKKAGLLADDNKLDEALTLLNQVAPIEHTNYEVYITLGWIMLQKNDIESAIKHFKKAVDLSFEDEEEILLEVGYNLSQSDIYDHAAYFLELLVQKNPSNENALFELAFCLEKLDQRQRSIEIYEQLLEINPFSENAWYNIGILYNKEERFLEAGMAYDYTIAINPLHSEAYFNKGNSLAHNGCYLEALDAYHEHVSLCQDVVLTYQYIADCWEQMGNYDMAIRFYQLVIKDLPESGDAWYGIGTALMEKEDFEGGLQAIDQAIAINPLNADYWFAHARGLFELDKAEDAARSLENGLSIDPEELSGWFEFVKLKMTIDQSFRPIAFLNELKIRYKECAAIQYLGVFIHLRIKNNTAYAANYLKKGLEMDSELLTSLLEEMPELIENTTIRPLLPSHQQA